MFVKAVLCLSTLHFYSVAAQGECTDLRGRQISHGLHYVPGPDTCTLCVCDNGLAKVCKAVLCSPPQDCRSFRVGNTCCEFICLDDVVKPAEGAEANVRVAAGGAAAVVLLTVALVVYRVRKQKRRRPPHTDDQRSLTSIGYISGSMGYMGGTCETALAAWKPPGNYFPRGEAPPPYDEAVAQCRSEAIRINETTFHRTYPATLETLARADDSMQCSGHAYVNIPRPVQQIANTQTCYNAPLLQTVHPPENREPTSIVHHPMPNVVGGFTGAVRLTGSLGAISAGAPPAPPPAPHPQSHPAHPAALAAHTSLHRTIPRISTAVDATIFDTALPGFNRADRSLHNEIRRSFHKPNEGNRHATDGRSMPRSLNLSSNDITRNSGDITRIGNDIVRSGTDFVRNGPDVRNAVDTTRKEIADDTRLNGGRSRAHSEEQNVGSDAKIQLQVKPLPKPPPTQSEAVPAPQSTLPLTVDKPSCVCSYEGTNAPGSEDADDYRSECENCKSASSSRWGPGAGWSAEGESQQTQTLQRRAPPPAPPPPATATLPQPVTRQSRTIMGPPSNWENWFNTIPDSDTESEEE